MPFSVSTRLRAVDRMSKVFKKVGKTGSRNMRKIGVAVGRVNKGVTGMMKRFGLASKIGGALLAGFSFAAIQSQISDTIRLGLDFEKTLVGAAAKFPGQIRKGSEAFDQLKQSAQEVGKTTEFTASEAAEGLNFLALAGFNASQSIAALPGAVDLATAAQTDLGQATDIATDSLGAFNLMTKDSVQLQENLARVSDVMAKTSVTANTSIEQLFEAIRSGGPVASAAGVHIEQFSAAAGLLANAGIKGEKAGTTLKNVFLKLQAPTSAGRRAFKQMGITLADENGNLKDFSRLLDEMNNKLPKGVKRAAALNDIFGKIPIAGVNILLNNGGKALRDYTAELQGATGFTKTLASVMRDNTDGALREMNSAIEGLKIQLFEAFAPAFKLAIKAVTKFTRIMSKAFELLGPFGPILIDIVIAITSAVAVLGLLVAAIVAVNAAIAVFNFLFSSSPIGLIILGIAALIFIIIQLIKHFDKIKLAFKVVIDFIFAGIVGVIQILAKLFAFVPFVGKGLKKLGDLGQQEIEASAKLRIEKSEEEEENRQGIKTPGVAGPEATVKTLQQTNETIEKSTAEVTIKDETGRAQVTKQTGSPDSFKLDLPPAWSF